MTIAWLVVLLLGIVAIICGVRAQEFRNATFWFLLAFWAYIVLMPWVGAVVPL